MLVVAFAVLVGALGAVGCGGSGSSSNSTVAQGELEAAKRQGEEAAEERERVDRLQRRVSRLARQARRARHPVVVQERGQGGEPAGSSEPVEASTVLRSFHAPSSNVSCEILSDGALCSVESLEETFTFGGGEAAYIQSGAQLPAGVGVEAPYGSTVQAGSVVCTVPASDSPRGVTCVDEGSGHGFEASRIASRQRVY